MTDLRTAQTTCGIRSSLLCSLLANAVFFTVASDADKHNSLSRPSGRARRDASKAGAWHHWLAHMHPQLTGCALAVNE